MRIAVYYDLARGGAADALARFVDYLRRGHAVDVYAPQGAFAVTRDVRVAGSQSTRTWPGPLYYANRLAAPARNVALARSESRLADSLGSYDRWLVHSCRGRGAPALLRYLERDSHFYVTEPLRLYREARPLDGVAAPVWLAARGAYLPIFAALNAADRRNARAAHRLIANSRYTASQVQSVYGRSSEVVPPAADPFFLEGEVGRGEGGFVLSPGALIPQKGHGRVIRALARWRQPPPLVVAGFRGRPGYVRRLRSLAGRRRVPLRLVPEPSRRDLRSLMREARIVALAPVGEPFGLVALEGQAAGRPVVVVDEGGLPETVVDGHTGVVASAEPAAFADALREIWCDERRQRRMGRAGRDHVRAHYRPERCGARLEALLSDPRRSEPGCGRSDARPGS